MKVFYWAPSFNPTQGARLYIAEYGAGSWTYYVEDLVTDSLVTKLLSEGFVEISDKTASLLGLPV